jgi:hypothetical protein
MLAPLADADTPAGGLGVNAGVLFGEPEAGWGHQLSAMESDGIRIVRTDATWNDIEPTPPSGGVHHYNWSITDAIVAALAEHDLTWLPIADYSTAWAASAQTGNGTADLYSAPRPADTSAYAEYVAALAARYGPGGSFWRSDRVLPQRPITAIEIWNEENGGYYWQPQNAATRYASLYEAARAAIHGVQPRVEAIVGGLIYPPDSFIEQLLAALGGRRGTVDAVALHPYAASLNATLAQVDQARTALDAQGDVNTPLDVTEFGWPTNGLSQLTFVPVLSDAARAVLMSNVTDAVARSDCGIERITPYAWLTPEQDPLEPEDWFGIEQTDGQPTLTSEAYSRTLDGLAASTAAQHATEPVCLRSLRLRSAPVPAIRHSRSQRPAKSHLACMIATVTSGGWPVSRARVRFQMRERVTAERSLSMLTNASGHAYTCLGFARSGRVWSETTASSPSFVPVPSSARSFVIR